MPVDTSSQNFEEQQRVIVAQLYVRVIGRGFYLAGDILVITLTAGLTALVCTVAVLCL